MGRPRSSQGKAGGPRRQPGAKSRATPAPAERRWSQAQGDYFWRRDAAVPVLAELACLGKDASEARVLEAFERLPKLNYYGSLGIRLRKMAKNSFGLADRVASLKAEIQGWEGPTPERRAELIRLVERSAAAWADAGSSTPGDRELSRRNDHD